MSGRKIIGLLLLGTLAVCAIGASGAGAAQTAFQCESGSGSTGYVDAHCVNETKVAAQVKFVHKSIAAGTETKVTFNNQETTNSTLQAAPTMLSTSVAGVLVDIVCFESSGSGTLTNVAGGSITGKAFAFEFSECVMPKPRSAGKTECKVNTPIQFKNVSAKNYENSENMGLEFSPEKKVFAEIVLTNGDTTCPLAGTYKLEGTMRSQYAGATGGSSTMLFETGAGQLTFGGTQANFYNRVTVKKEGTGIGIALTTGE